MLMLSRVEDVLRRRGMQARLDGLALTGESWDVGEPRGRDEAWSRRRRWAGRRTICGGITGSGGPQSWGILCVWAQHAASRALQHGNWGRCFPKGEYACRTIGGTENATNRQVPSISGSKPWPQSPKDMDKRRKSRKGRARRTQMKSCISLRMTAIG